MSDAPITDQGGVPTPPASVPTPPTQDYQALWEREKNERIAEREKYKPFAQVLDQLDPDARSAILGLASAAAAQDVDSIAEWSAQTYRNLKGSDVAAMIAQQQNGQQPPAMQAPVAQPEPSQQQYLTAEQAAEIARQQAQQLLSTQQMAQQIGQKLDAAGYPAQSAGGRTIIEYAKSTGLPIDDAIAWYHNENLAMWQRQAQAGQQAAGALPPNAPVGAPAANAAPTNLSPREAAIARLSANRNNG